MDPKNRAKLMINKLSSKDQNFTAQLKALTSWDNSSKEEVNRIVKKTQNIQKFKKHKKYKSTKIKNSPAPAFR